MSNKRINDKIFTKENSTLFILLLVYSILQLKNINLDFWNDEVYTLKNFVFVPFHKIITDYHVPNNHVFFSIITKFYLKIIGINSLYDLMDRPWSLRLLMLLISYFTILLTYLLSRNIYGKDIAFLCIVILITTIPYFNFCLQIRGYMLSTFLFVFLLYSVWIYLHST